MSPEQQQTILYAYLDLKGAIEAIESNTNEFVDISNMRQTTEEMEREFPFVLED